MENKKSFELYTNLIQSAENGESEAFLALYHLTYSTEFGIALRVLNNYHYAEDAVQEAYLNAFRDLGNLRDAQHFLPWLNQITYRKSVEVLKTIKKHQTDNLDLLTDHDLETLKTDAPPNPADLAIQKELNDNLLAIIEQLPKRQQTALKGRYFQFLTNKEIAQQMNCTEPDVKYYVRSGKQKLAKLLKTFYEQDGKYKNWVFAPFFPRMLKTLAAEMSAEHVVSTQAYIAGFSVRPLTAVICALCILTGAGAGASLVYSEMNTRHYPNTASANAFDVHINSGAQKDGSYVAQREITISGLGGSNIHEVRINGVSTPSDSPPENPAYHTILRQNGTYNLEIESDKGSIKTSELSIQNIDAEPPVVSEYRCSSNRLELKLQDVRSGIDSGSIYGILPDGTKIYPETSLSASSKSTETIQTVFSSVQFPLSLRCKDTVGNEMIYECLEE